MRDDENSLSEKRFDLERWSGKRIGKNKRTSLVTIVTAIIGRDGIIMAGDSRTTNEDGLPRDDTKKVFPVRLQAGLGFLLGQSGSDDLGTRAVELVYQLAKQTPIKDYRTCAEIAEKAVAQLKDEIRLQFHGTSEELQKHFERHDFEFLLAHYYKEDSKDGKLTAPLPYIFTLRFSTGIARRHFDKNFVSIGCGSPIADFILDGFSVRDFDFSQNIATAVYALGQVKEFDPRCGGRIRVASAEKVFWKDGSYMTPAFEVDEKLVDDFEKAIEEVIVEFRQHQHKLMTGIMEKVNKFISPRIEEMKAQHGGIHIAFDGSINPYTPPKLE
jgi:20S proteasome alpha/beta subunit